MSDGDQGERRRRAQEAIEANRAWYHSIELAPGVVTPGRVDMRRVANRVFPDDLSGLRALDVGTFDGFWAFEMEKRGAEVVAIDVERIEHAEWPPVQRDRLKRESDRHGVELGLGFKLASELLGSSVRRVTCNVYDLEPDVIGGPVDFVFSGAIMLHLRDPVKALERIAGALRAGGELRLFEPFSVALTMRSPRTPAARFSAVDTEFNWWVPNLAGLRAWALAAGFAEVERVALLRPPSVRRMRHGYAALACRTAAAHR